ncbi:MAG: D-erythronate dehydrogenase [Granulosicoccus sp.]
MDLLIIGAAGMIGRKLATRLIEQKTLAGQTIDSLALVDVVEPQISMESPVRVNTSVADLTQAGVAQRLIATRPDFIYHLAAIVSGEAEANMDKGYRINLDGTRELLEAIKTEHDKDGYAPTFIFTSSIAVYGAPFPEVIDDEFHLTPLTSYGTQKAMCELLLADYHRRGIVKGIGLRLPTICVRPGLPNAAASGFFSGILREPINGQTAILPVADTVRHWFASPRAAIGFLMHAATLSREQIGLRCNMNLPGLSATVAEQIESLGKMIGSDAVALIRREADPVIASIVSGWPEMFSADRASALGFQAENSFDDIIQVYLDEEMRHVNA